MSGYADYTGCTAFIHDEKTGDRRAETIVRNHDRAEHIITVDARPFGSWDPSQVIVLVLSGGEITEYRGTMRKQKATDFRREIAIFKGQTKEARRTTRYTVVINARIENAIISGNVMRMPNPLDVQVENISTDGVLLHSAVSFFHVGSSFQLALDIGGQKTLLNTTVVRLKALVGGGVEYGCKFLPQK